MHMMLGMYIVYIYSDTVCVYSVVVYTYFDITVIFFLYFTSE
jgi:hypothetical protein